MRSNNAKQKRKNDNEEDEGEEEEEDGTKEGNRSVTNRRGDLEWTKMQFELMTGEILYFHSKLSIAYARVA